MTTLASQRAVQLQEPQQTSSRLSSSASATFVCLARRRRRRRGRAPQASERESLFVRFTGKSRRAGCATRATTAQPHQQQQRPFNYQSAACLSLSLTLMPTKRPFKYASHRARARALEASSLNNLSSAPAPSSSSSGWCLAQPASWLDLRRDQRLNNGRQRDTLAGPLASSCLRRKLEPVDCSLPSCCCAPLARQLVARRLSHLLALRWSRRLRRRCRRRRRLSGGSPENPQDAARRLASRAQPPNRPRMARPRETRPHTSALACAS